MKLAEWQAGGSEYVHCGQRTFYRTGGEGPPLLLVHGFPTASWDWHKVWPGLSPRYRLVAPDLVGYGLSAKPRDYRYGAFDHADQVEGLMAALGHERYGVLCHDYGDTVTQELLARCRERGRPELRFVCMLNGGIYPEAHRARLVQKLLLGPLGPWVSRLIDKRSFARSFSAVFGPHTRPDELELATFWELVSRDGGLANYHLLIRYIDERRAHRERWVAAIEQPPVPLRLVCGALDPVSGRHMAEHFQRRCPSAEIVILDDAGHYPQTEAFDRVLAAFESFAGAF